jgi:hypothetical protein
MKESQTPTFVKLCVLGGSRIGKEPASLYADICQYCRVSRIRAAACLCCKISTPLL